MKTFDCIIIGAGSGGCVVASRLSEDPKLQVALIEAGSDFPPTQTPQEIADPRGRAMYRSKYLWPDSYVSRTQQDADRSVRDYMYLQGRVIGGSSAVNAMLAMLPQPMDLDEWAELGCTDWDMAAMIPFLEKVVGTGWQETGDLPKNGAVSLRPSNDIDTSPFVSGLLGEVASENVDRLHNLATCFDDGVASIPKTQCANGRVSAADAYLSEAVRARPNLHILSDRKVRKINFDGTRVRSVAVAGSGPTEDIGGRAVVVCAGAFHSPSLLMRSGIGAGETLRSLGLEVVSDRPGVGQNLHEHPTVGLAAHLAPKARVSSSDKDVPYVVRRYSSGIGSNGERDMFMSLRAQHGWHAVGRQLGGIHVAVYKPTARGTVRLTSADPDAPPVIDLNLLGSDHDRARMASGVKEAVRLLQRTGVAEMWSQILPLSAPERVKRFNEWSTLKAFQLRAAAMFLDASPALRSLLFGKFLQKGRRLEDILASDTGMSDWLDAAVYGSWHVAGTCRMGDPSARETVVDPSGQVLGTEGLWVADASIMPTPVRSTTNLTVMMIGEKIASDVRAAISA